MIATARPFGRLNRAGALMRLEAYQALYAAAWAVDGSIAPGESLPVAPIQQGGADVARMMRERFLAEARAVVVDATGRFDDPSRRH
ncbi:hypothetical protein E8L99_20330 [Phreatobacter aquaticus]|uniref:Uncharacterized protein n=1 Tax=Phreatobacter aquaticus TaxID=2570229 RepID=A0A4D7QVC4_9HYPH|nr:hypothetical protein [Phreatobacter aquaticus]QCK87932.1 hypothetical protein E8L99_20330 [Phreatobacter aquaticus]